MAADKQAIILSRVHACCSIIVTCHYAKCNPSLRDICLFCSWTLLTLRACTKSIYHLLHTLMVLWENEYCVKVWFYIALYPVRWSAQSALHFPPLADLFIPTPFSASLGSILAMQQLRNDYSLTFPPLSIARYSFIQLSRLRRRKVKENAQTSKR